jgi:hypothetical protein
MKVLYDFIQTIAYRMERCGDSYDIPHQNSSTPPIDSHARLCPYRTAKLHPKLVFYCKLYQILIQTLNPNKCAAELTSQAWCRERTYRNILLANEINSPSDHK